ncbi:MAG: CYTH domain-containing protein [Bacteroidota bacterium]
MRDLEIERKFLVSSDAYKKEASSKIKIVQGFLNTHPERTVRVRTMGGSGFLTVKGKSNASGTSRFEWERELTDKEALALMKLCEPGIIAKYRYRIHFADKVFEVDEFLEDSLGLVLAEIELNHENEVFKRPKWLGEEVTGQVQYYNSSLTQKPFKKW